MEGTRVKKESTPPYNCKVLHFRTLREKKKFWFLPGSIFILLFKYNPDEQQHMTY